MRAQLGFIPDPAWYRAIIAKIMLSGPSRTW